MKKNLSVTLVIPVFNSEISVPPLYSRLIPVLNETASEYEIIFVDDASRDQSWQVIEKLACHDEKVRGIGFTKNFGQHNALLCGIRAAKYEVIVTIDDDLKHSPESIPLLLKKLREGSDVVYGAPKVLPSPFCRSLISLVLKRVLAKLTGVSSVRDLSAFRAFKTSLRESFASDQGADVLLDELLAKATRSFSSVAVFYETRVYRKSQYTVAKLFKQTVLLFTRFSAVSLKARRGPCGGSSYLIREKTKAYVAF